MVRLENCFCNSNKKTLNNLNYFWKKYLCLGWKIKHACECTWKQYTLKVKAFEKEIISLWFTLVIILDPILAFSSGGARTCDICGRTCQNLKSLKKHKKTHIEGSKEKFKCTVCGNGFRDRTKLKVSYMQQKQFQFCLCWNDYYYLILVITCLCFKQEHSYIHSGKMAYFCQFCGKPFRFGSSLSIHRKICKERHSLTKWVNIWNTFGPGFSKQH